MSEREGGGRGGERESEGRVAAATAELTTATGVPGPKRSYSLAALLRVPVKSAVHSDCWSLPKPCSESVAAYSQGPLSLWLGRLTTTSAVTR